LQRATVEELEKAIAYLEKGEHAGVASRAERILRMKAQVQIIAGQRRLAWEHEKET
jgi:hypothetical protein